MMEFRLIDVVSIVSKVPRSEFDEVELAQLAESILECKGVLTPPVLKVIGLDSYEVIEGDREYYAAVVARENNPRQGEMINAFVVPPKYEENIRKQLAVLQRGLTTPMTVATPSITSSTAPSITSPELAGLAKRFDNFQQVVNSQFAKLAERVDNFQQVVNSQFDKNEHFQAQLLAAVHQDRIEAKETPDKIWQQLVLIETLVREVKKAPAIISPVPPPPVLSSPPSFNLGSAKLDCGNKKITVVELKTEAKKWKIPKYYGMNKAELIEALKKVGAC